MTAGPLPSLTASRSIANYDRSVPRPTDRRRATSPANGYRGPGIKVRVPAKINLHLAIGDRRPDGYHELMTLFHSVSVYDTLTITPADRLSIEIVGDTARDVPADHTNLAWQAASSLAERHGIEPFVHIEIHKSIPVAAGMAGGSADAAAALVGCDALWNLHTSRAGLTDLATELGSDVAFSLHGGNAIGTGRGETLSPVLGAHEQLWWVLALADGGLSTPTVYAEFDRQKAEADAAQNQPDPLAPPTELLMALRDEDVQAVAGALRNDLQPAAVSLDPSLQSTLDAGLMLGAMGALVSGSGPTCAFLVANAESARTLASRLTRENVCRTTRVAAGPTHGAQLC
ncbi:MAG: 4-diphosphocytidyl-2C-methyl-D-erythritol kinase [Pseudonocardiales bacterium]|nr:4-diphosphocytidyl-2C-methyl-D-erythritol kinase [Pseudonocardiales bacterium]